MDSPNNIPHVHRINWIDQTIRTIIITGMLIAGAISMLEIFTNFSTQWFWLLLATYYTITVNETFTHRVCGHKMFKVDVTSWTYKIMTFVSSADLGHGPVRSMALGHRAHHIYADQGQADPINMKEFWFGIACAMPFRGWFKNPKIPDPQNFLKKSYQQHQEIIDDPWTQFCESHATIISITYLAALYVFLPTVLFNVVLTGRLILVLGMVGAGICHIKHIPLTYRHVETPDNSNNNLLLHYLFLGIFGGLLQNNHHSHPNRLNMGRTWYEIDTSTPVAYLLKFLIAKKENQYENI
jgi:stearoyl-CoA desaturase (Delta-9 desaturase)